MKGSITAQKMLQISAVFCFTVLVLVGLTIFYRQLPKPSEEVSTKPEEPMILPYAFPATGAFAPVPAREALMKGRSEAEIVKLKKEIIFMASRETTLSVLEKKNISESIADQKILLFNFSEEEKAIIIEALNRK